MTRGIAERDLGGVGPQFGVLLLALGGCVNVDTTKDDKVGDEAKAVEDTVRRSQEAENAGNADAFLALWTDEGLEEYDVGSREEIQKGGYVVVGSPATVRDRLTEIATHTGLGTLIPNFSVGNVPHHLTRKSVELFAREVMPHLRTVNVDPPAHEVQPAGVSVSA